MLRKRLRVWIGIFVLQSLLVPLSASASSSLERMSEFFTNQSTYFAEFNQVILDEGLHLVEESAGLMWLSRPNKFRWEYDEPFEQTVVSDGTYIWVYDSELEQASVRDLSDVLDQSAAEILSGSGDIEDKYTVEDLGVQGALAWVTLRPLNQDYSQFESLRLGFDNRTLRIMEILDTLGDTTRIQMQDVVLGSDFQDKAFEFSVPEGVDLIDSREVEDNSN